MLLLIQMGDERSGVCTRGLLVCRYFGVGSIAEGEYLNTSKAVCMYMKYIKSLENVPIHG